MFSRFSLPALSRPLIIGAALLHISAFIGSSSLVFAQDPYSMNTSCAMNRCDACHTMHNSQDAVLVDANSPTGNAFLLNDETPSDTCLDCHSQYGQNSSDGQTLGPGGDFYWTTRDFSWTDSDGTEFTVEGRECGHNIDAPGFGLKVDDTLTVAPGGTYDSSRMGCNSCHDPHGNTNFRMLYGVGATAADYPGGYQFSYPAPIAQGNSPQTGLADPGAEKFGQHTAYISGMSEWCANCHEGIHSATTTNTVHPVDISLGSRMSSIYNEYRTSGDMSGDRATAYLPLVPFEDVANTVSSTSGATASSKVMCLTCHRAHASPFRDAGRWDFDQTYSLLNRPSSEPYLAQYVNNPLEPTNQRNLCNKCHAMDVNDRMARAVP